MEITLNDNLGFRHHKIISQIEILIRVINPHVSWLTIGRELDGNSILVNWYNIWMEIRSFPVERGG